MARRLLRKRPPLRRWRSEDGKVVSLRYARFRPWQEHPALEGEDTPAARYWRDQYDQMHRAARQIEYELAKSGEVLSQIKALATLRKVEIDGTSRPQEKTR